MKKQKRNKFIGWFLSVLLLCSMTLVLAGTAFGASLSEEIALEYGISSEEDLSSGEEMEYTEEDLSSGEEMEFTGEESAKEAEQLVLEEWAEAEVSALEADCGYNGFLVELAQEVPASESLEPVAYTDNLCVAGSVDDLLQEVEAENILSIEPNYQISLCSDAEPDDPGYVKGYQSYLDLMKTDTIWKYGLDGTAQDGGDPVTVAIIDTGINLNHEDLDPSNVLPGRRWHNDDTTDVADWQGHGTLCASMIMAMKDNGIGMAGIVPAVQIMPLSIFYRENNKTTADMADLVSAVNYAVENGADVINMSLGDPVKSNKLEQACSDAAEAGVLLVASAGNAGTEDLNYPAAFDNVVGVGSVGTKDDPLMVSDFSQRGMDNVFCVAPGYRVYGAGYRTSDSYVRNSGTSFSAPEVSALAALAKSLRRDITQQDFEKLIMDTSIDLGDPGRDAVYGYGLIDFEAVLKILCDTTFTLSPESLEIATNHSAQLDAVLKTDPAVDPSVIWESSDENIAVVDENGVVTAKRYGTAVITAYPVISKSLKQQCTIQTRFYDVNNPSSYFYEPVYWAADNGLVSGYDNVYIGVNNSCTRKQMLVMLWRYAGCPEVSGKVPFPDAQYSTNSASRKAILWGWKTGIVQGYSNGNFGPDDPVSRKQTLIMLYRLNGQPAVSGKLKFTDVKASARSATYKAILWGRKLKITNGYADGTFHPNDYCLRKQIITFVYRYHLAMEQASGGNGL